MLAVAAGCLALSVRPTLAIGPVSAFAGQVFGPETAVGVVTLAPSLGALGTASAVVIASLAVVFLLVALRVRDPAPSRPTWDCGYVAPSARMQYTARSFAQLAATLLLPRSLRPRVNEQRPQGIFPQPAAFAAEEADPVTRRWYEPFFTRWADRFASLRWVQQGVLHAYLFYILAVAVTALAWGALRGWALR
jgi:hypothetical protein